MSKEYEVKLSQLFLANSINTNRKSSKNSESDTDEDTLEKPCKNVDIKTENVSNMDAIDKKPDGEIV